MNTSVLETERLILRPLKVDDVQEVFDCWMQDEDVCRYMHWHSTDDINVAQYFVDYEVSMIDSDKWFRWVIADKESKVLYGTCLIYFNEDEDCWDIAYNLGKQYWGKGYATEAMKKVMEFGVQTIGVKEVIAAHAIENPASGKVITKLGFKYEKDIPYDCNGGEIHTTGKQYRFIIE